MFGKKLSQLVDYLKAGLHWHLKIQKHQGDGLDAQGVPSTFSLIANSNGGVNGLLTIVAEFYLFDDA
jgi:hypothetical protein